MNDEHKEQDDQLAQLLVSARPVADLPPGFASQVWRRIEQGEPAGIGFWPGLAVWWRKPKMVWAGLAVLLLAAGVLGAARGVQSGEDLARARYVSSVDPAHGEHLRR